MIENKSAEPTISHLRKDMSDGHWVIQTNEEHSNGVAKLASGFAAEFGLASWGNVLGLLHDKGKERTEFQQYIRRESGYQPNLPTVGEHNHAYVGGLIANESYGGSSRDLLVNQIISHHTGLHDSDELSAELRKKIPGEVKKSEKFVLGKIGFSSPINQTDIHHLSRMLFSCLVDADYLDTEKFMDSSASELRGGKANLKDLLPRLDSFLSELKSNSQESEVNRIRNEVQNRCLETAEMEPGFYSLTVPTGGGKTLSSLVWAIHHAVRHGLKRIIIAIPYTSIIVQTAAMLKSIFGEENVLEHHSNVDPEKIKDERLRSSMQMAMENWDYPIIVTTNVQLFESMFDNRPSHCRKLHNIVKSVLILDEVQTLPMDYLQPIVDTLKTYEKLFGVSVLFTTASQPVLSGTIDGCNPTANFNGIDTVTEIIPEDYRLHERLRRVQLEIDDSGNTYDEIARKLCEHEKVLCIVNTRKDAAEIFKRLPDEGISLHLSRNMCSAHINETIRKIKDALKDKKNSIVRVVATQLVEAGVDIDFPVVYRQEAGLDSVLQAAGRCNREGCMDICTTHVFSLLKENRQLVGDIKDGNDARKNLVGERDWFAPETMSDYFKQLYCRRDTFDKSGMGNLLYDVNCMQFKTASECFNLIDDNGTTIFVNWGGSSNLIQALKRNGPSYGLMKKLSKYGVSVRSRTLEQLNDIGALEEITEGVLWVPQSAQYDTRLGLIVDAVMEKENLII